MEPKQSPQVISYTQQSRSLSTPPPPQVQIQASTAPPDTPDGVMYIGTVPGRAVVSRVGTRKRAASAISVAPQNMQATVRVPDNATAEVDETQQVFVIAETPTDKNARARQNERARRQYYKDQSSRLRELLVPEIQEWVASTGNKKQPNEGQLMFVAAEKIDTQMRELEEKDTELEIKNAALEQKEAELQQLRTEFGELSRKAGTSKAMCQKFVNITRHVGKGFAFYKSRYHAQCEAQNIEPEVFATEVNMEKIIQFATNVGMPQNRFVSLQDVARHQTPQQIAAAGCQGALAAPANYPQTNMIRIKQEADQGQTQNQDVARNNVRTMILSGNGNGMFFQPTIRMPLHPQAQRYQVGQILNSQSLNHQQQFMAQQQQRQVVQQHFLQNGINNLRITNAPGQALPTVYACSSQQLQQQAYMPPQTSFESLKHEPMDMPDVGSHANPYAQAPQSNYINVKHEPMDMPDVGGNSNLLQFQPQYFFPRMTDEQPANATTVGIKTDAPMASATTVGIKTEEAHPSAATVGIRTDETQAFGTTVAIKTEPEDYETEREEEKASQQNGTSTSTSTQSPPEAAGEGQFQQAAASAAMFSMPGFSEDLHAPERGRTYPKHPDYPPEPADEPSWRVVTAEVLLDDENVFKRIYPQFNDFLWHGHLEKKETWKSDTQKIFQDLTNQTLAQCQDTLVKEKQLAEAELEKNKNKGKKRNQDEDTEPKKRGRKKKYARR